MIAEAIFARLSGHAGVSALVGSRIYPVKAPQNPVTSFVVYRQISNTYWRSIDGSSGVCRPRYQFDAYASTYDGARELAEQLRLALDDWSEGDVMSTSLESETDMVDTSAEPTLYRVSLDFFITHRQ